MADPQIFAQITKVDENSRTVFGRATQEVPDYSGEIFDYASSKPHFEKWSAEVSRATAGKSQGNLRVMHQPVAAGKITQMVCNDAEKAIDIAAKVVDDSEWQKVLEGVYTGFSIGGKYGNTWEDPKDADLTRFTAIPSEISLVDAPCVPTATYFEIHKADGSVLQKNFKGNAMDKVADRKDVSESDKKHAEEEYGDVKYADEKNKKYPIDTEEHIRAAWNYINKEENASKYDAEDVKSIKAKIVAAWKDKIDKDGPPSADAEKARTDADNIPEVDELENDNKRTEAEFNNANNQPEDADTPDAEDFEYDKAITVTGSPEEVDALAKHMEAEKLSVGEVLGLLKSVSTKDIKKGSAFRAIADLDKVTWADEANKRFPLDTEAQVKAAWYYANQAGEHYSADELAVLKERVHKAYVDICGAEPEAVEKAKPADLRKGFYECAELAQMAASLEWMIQSAMWESFCEGDNSQEAEKLKTALAAVIDALQACVGEEGEEDKEGTQFLEMARSIKGLAKRLPMEKKGARHNSKDADHLQKAHDALVEMGAKCMKDDDMEMAAPTGELAKALGEVGELKKANEELANRIKKLEEQPMPAKARLFVVGREQDVNASEEVAKAAEVQPVVSGAEVNEAATLIKSIHKNGGTRINLGITKN